VHVCNPSYLGDGDGEDCYLSTAHKKDKETPSHQTTLASWVVPVILGGINREVAVRD
jgi:hypothetical protein